MTGGAETRTGRCACGGVTFEAAAGNGYGACHCETCRRWAGGVYMAIEARAVRFSAPENVLRWRSSDWAERGSCRLCGSALFWRFLEGETHMLNVGTLDEQSDLVFEAEVFVEEQPEHYRFAGERETMTGAEVMLRHGGGGGG